MDVSRLDRGLQIAGAGGVVLLISLFLPWYGVTASLGGVSISDSANAWEAFGFADFLMFVAAVVAIAAAAATATDNVPPALPVPIGRAVSFVGGVAFLLVLFRIIDIPGSDFGGVDVGRKFGAFLALIAAGAIAYGGRELEKKGI